MNTVAKELLTQSPLPSFASDSEGKKTRLFSKEFLTIVNDVSQKYQLTAHQLIKDQQDRRRYKALETQDNVLYSKAFYETEMRKVDLAVQIEDMIFDYFGIIAIQYEMSNEALKRDMQFQVDKMKRQAELASQVMKKEKPLKELGMEQA
jgi:hypothetical protein